MAFFEKEGTLVNGELSLLKEIFTENETIQNITSKNVFTAGHR